MVTKSHTRLQYKAIVCVIIYDLLLPASIKVFKYFSQRFIYYTDVKYLVVAKKLYLLKTFTIDNDSKFE